MTHTHAPSSSTLKGIRTAFFLNLAFTVFEVLGGFWTNSVAILADALHDLGDSFALGAAWYFERVAGRKGDARYSYGYRRFSLVGALLSAAVLVTGTLFILSEAVPRLLQPERTHAPGMIVMAVVGCMVNGVAALRLRRAPGFNARMVAWHLLEDALGWLAILAAGALLLVRDVPVLDPALSILITLYVLWNVIRNLRKTMGVFLQGTPEDVDLPALEAELREIGGVAGLHHTHVWSMDGVHHVLTTHAIIAADAGKADQLRIKEAIQTVVARRGIAHSTVELEYADERCRIRDKNCR
jgi:cobalt-zinc-cadmium efflux system protein